MPTSACRPSSCLPSLRFWRTSLIHASCRPLPLCLDLLETSWECSLHEQNGSKLSIAFRMLLHRMAGYLRSSSLMAIQLYSGRKSCTTPAKGWCVKPLQDRGMVLTALMTSLARSPSLTGCSANSCATLARLFCRSPPPHKPYSLAWTHLFWFADTSRKA